MHKNAKRIQAELAELQCMPIFEISVTNVQTGERDYVVADISVRRNTLIAQRVAVSSKEERSKFIAETTLAIDESSLDSHLEELLAQLNEDICAGELFELVN